VAIGFCGFLFFKMGYDAGRDAEFRKREKERKQ
jgi:hypothetical protein